MMLGIALLGLLAQADDSKEAVYKRLALGDRVEITFRSGRTIAGKLVSSPQGRKAEKVESVDYTKEKSLTVDVSLEYPGLSGTMTVRKDEVRAIRILGELSEKDRKNLEEQKRLIEEERKKAEEKPPAPKPEPEKPPAAEKPQEKDPAAEAETKKREDLKKGEALYAKYPPPDWGPDRNTAIRLKRLRGLVLPPIEKEFHEGFELWDLYRRTVAEAKKKPSGK